MDHKERLSRDSRRAKKAESIYTGAISVEPRANGSFVDESSSTPVAGVSFAAVAAAQDAEDEKLLENSISDVRFFLFWKLCTWF